MTTPDVPSAAERRIAATLFVGLILGFPLQHYAKYRTGDEPYPGTFMPSFGAPGTSKDSIAIVRDRLVAFYEGGRSELIPVQDFLGQIPVSHHGTFLATYFRAPASLGPAGEEERRIWTRSRLAAIASGRMSDSLAVVTERLVVIGSDSVIEVLSRSTLDLATRDP